MKPNTLGIFSAMLTNILLIPCSHGQQLTPIPVESALSPKQFTALSTIEFSPDGKSLVYAAEDPRQRRLISDGDALRTGLRSFHSGSDVYIVNAVNGDKRNLTGGKGGNWNPSWSADGKYLAFLSDRDGGGVVKLWVWEPARDSLRKVSDIHVAALTDRIRWLPDSRRIFVATSPDQAGRGAGRADRRPEMGIAAETAGSTATVFKSGPLLGDRSVVARSDPWDLDLFLQDLVLVDVENGSVTMLDRGHRVVDRILSTDGRTVVITSPTRFVEAGSRQTFCDLATIDVVSAKANTLLRDVRIGSSCTGVSLSPDGSKLSYQSMDEATKANYVVLDLKGQAIPRNVSLFPTSSKTGHGGAPVWDPDGRYIVMCLGNSIWKSALDGSGATRLAAFPDRLVLVILSRNGKNFWSTDGNRSMVVVTQSETYGKESGFYKIDVSSGETTALLEGKTCLTCTAQRAFVYPSADGHHAAYIAEDAEHPADLWIADGNFRGPHRLTRLNPEMDLYRMGGTRLIEWQSLDGEVLHGIVQLPAGYEVGKRYPLIVCVYGGHLLSQGENRFGGFTGLGLNSQLLATRGYSVLYPDAPQELGTPMLDLAKTILPGVSKAVELGIADPDRLGVIGHSYGGYTTLSLLVQTKRFKAAVMASGYGDIVSTYGQFGKNGSAYHTSLEEQGQGLMGGTPWQFRERYIENSPIFYLDRVETPLLILHGTADPTVASFLGDEVFVDLRRLGKEVEYARYEGEGHGLDGSYANQLDSTNRVIRWFDEHLKSVQKK
jgi:dipeptidyl aminopeptidase/acylaminoacyl peptidase